MEGRVGDERRLEGRRGARVIALRRRRARWRRARTARRRAARFERLDLVEDRGRRALHERDEPRRVDAYGRPGRRAPLGAPAEQAGAEVELALVCEQLPVADVERLVVDEQADELPVRGVDDRLAGLRVAEAGLGVRERPQLVERVQVRAGEPVRLALVEVRRAGRCARWRARTSTRSARARRGRGTSRAPPTDRPRRPGCLITREQLGEVGDDDVGAVLPQRVGLPDAVDADDEAEVSCARRFDPGERVLEDRAAATARRRARRGARGTCPAPASRAGARARRRSRRPAPRTGRRSRPPPAPRGSWRSPRRRPGAGPSRGRRRRSAPTPRTASTPSRWIVASTSSFLRLPRPMTVSASGRSLGVPSGSTIPREARNERTPSRRSLPSTYSS